MRLTAIIAMFVPGMLFVLLDRHAHAQTFGIELHNTLMPASAGMAGTSLARPQDLQSAINGKVRWILLHHFQRGLAIVGHA